MIYVTPFDPVTLQCTGASQPAGLDSFDAVLSMMGTPHGIARRMLTYPGWAYTDFVLHIDSAVKGGVSSAGKESPP